jgi:hypothetical protein
MESLRGHVNPLHPALDCHFYALAQIYADRVAARGTERLTLDEAS